LRILPAAPAVRNTLPAGEIKQGKKPGRIVRAIFKESKVYFVNYN